jgi:hypothetical protein
MSGFISYDAVIAACTAGKQQDIVFSKTISTSIATAFYSLWNAPGVPAAGAYTAGPSTVPRVINPTVQGGMNFSNAAVANQRFFTGIGGAVTYGPHTFMLVDRLLDYGAVSTATAVTTTFNTTPVLTRYTDGVGVKAFIEVTSALGGVSCVVQINYTNQAGTAGRVSQAVTMGITAVGGLQSSFMFVPMQGTDTGIRSVESMTISGTVTSGYVTAVLCRPVAMLPGQATAYIERDMLLQTPRPFQSVDEASYQWIMQSGATTSGPFSGMLSAVEP